MWRGEALCRLGVLDVRVLLLLDGFSFQVWLQHLSQVFAFRNSHYLLPPSSCHLEHISFFAFTTLKKIQGANK
jgi:hypothetical protein